MCEIDSLTNMKKRLMIACLLLPLISFSQNKGFLSGGFESYAQYYSKDQNQFAADFKDYFRSNNYLKLDYQYQNFSAGLQLESYAPNSLLNFDPKLNKELGLATYYLKYEIKNIEITAGYFYEQFGSGLILRFWEDRQLGINNSLRGGRVKFSPYKSVYFTALYGNQRSGFNVSDGTITGLDFEVDLNDILSININKYNIQLGFSYVNRHQVFEMPGDEERGTTHAYSSRLSYSKGSFYSNAEYIIKTKDALVESGQIMQDKLFEGNALLVNMGYSLPGFGMNASFRRLENMNFYSERENSGNIYNRSIVNYIPSLTKQHDYSLANIYIYQTQSNLSFNPLGKAGEIGFQIDVFYNIQKGSALGGKYGTKLAFNYSQWHGLDAEFDIPNRTYTSSFMTFGEKYFHDLNIEIKKKWSPKTSSIFSLINSFYNKKYIEESNGKIDFTVIAAESVLKLKSGRSMKFIAQHLWTQDDKKNWLGSTFEFNFSSNLSVFVSDMYNYGNDDTAEREHFYNVGGNFSKGRFRMSLSYGKQRGGLLCLGGICRVVPESTGLTMTLNTSF